MNPSEQDLKLLWKQEMRLRVFKEKNFRQLGLDGSPRFLLGIILWALLNATGVFIFILYIFAP